MIVGGRVTKHVAGKKTTIYSIRDAFRRTVPNNLPEPQIRELCRHFADDGRGAKLNL